MNTPDISVIIPVYPNLNYLPRALDSIRNQIFKDIKVIIVFDGIKDFDLYKTNQYSDLSITTIWHETNRSPIQARWSGIDKATSKYTFFFDVDDALTPNYLYDLVNIAERENADMVGGNMSTFKQNFIFTVEGDERLHYLHHKIDIAECHAVRYLYKTDIVKKGKENLNLPHDAFLNYSEDLLMNAVFIHASNKIVEDTRIKDYVYCKDNPLSTTIQMRANSDFDAKQRVHQKEMHVYLEEFLNRYQIDKKSIGYRTNQFGEYILPHTHKIIR